MKSIYTFLLLTFIAVPAMSQQMFVEKSAGTETIDFSNLDKITFSGTTVNIIQTDGKTIQAGMGDIDRIHFSNYNGIEEMNYNSEALFCYVSNDGILVNCNADEIIDIYNVTGSKLASIRQKADNGTISIAQLPKGIYIIRVNDRTAKFVKR